MHRRSRPGNEIRSVAGLDASRGGPEGTAPFAHPMKRARCESRLLAFSAGYSEEVVRSQDRQEREHSRNDQDGDQTGWFSSSDYY